MLTTCPCMTITTQKLSKPKKDCGFSLLEIAVVMLIIGLIIGSVFVGRYMIRAAEIRSIMKEADAYVTAVNTFKIKYNALPGDMLDATNYFGQKLDCSDRAETSLTCNGNSDGRIYGGVSGVTTVNESFLLWQHLANAGLISGAYNGVEGLLGPLHVEPGINTPITRISDAAWSSLYQNFSDGITISTEHWFMNYGNFLTLGRYDPNLDPGNDHWNHIPSTTPAEAWGIDQKVDDGKPGAGKFVARYWSIIGSATPVSNSCTLATSDTDFNADYNLRNEEMVCQPQYNDVY